jgi:hypothetical protein
MTRALPARLIDVALLALPVMIGAAALDANVNGDTKRPCAPASPRSPTASSASNSAPGL